MKRLSFAIILTCLAMAVSAQESIRVNYKGARPTISDFASAFLFDYVYDEDEDVLDEARSGAKAAWTRHCKGFPQPEGISLTIDEKNGYAAIEFRDEYEGDESLVRIEMCYWNETDKRHKLFAYNVTCFQNGKYSSGQFDGLLFYRYDSVTKKMTSCEAPGFEEKYSTEDGAWVSYSLPRTGKDIIYTEWRDGGKKQKTLKWNGRKFNF